MTQISKDTMVTIEGKKVSLETLFKMGPALGLGVPAALPEKPVRKIVKPSGADVLTKAAQSLAPTTPAQPTVVATATSAKTYEDVTITITREAVVLKEGTPAQDMFVLCKRAPSPGGKGKPRKGTAASHYNYRFDKGFCYHHTLGATPPLPGWKWDTKREVKYIPIDALETLLRGLRETYSGATLIIGDQKVTL